MPLVRGFEQSCSNWMYRYLRNDLILTGMTLTGWCYLIGHVWLATPDKLQRGSSLWWQISMTSSNFVVFTNRRLVYSGELYGDGFLSNRQDRLTDLDEQSWYDQHMYLSSTVLFERPWTCTIRKLDTIQFSNVFLCWDRTYAIGSFSAMNCNQKLIQCNELQSNAHSVQ